MNIKLTVKSILFLLIPVKINVEGKIKNMYYNDYAILEIKKSEPIELIILGKKKKIHFENADDSIEKYYELKIAPNYLLVFLLAVFLLITSIGIQIINNEHFGFLVSFLLLITILFQYRILDYLLIIEENKN
jgi:hypothetical protein